MRETTSDLIDWQLGQKALHNGTVVTLISFPTSSGYSPARLGHRCRFGADCRRWDIDGGATAFAWECELASTCEQPTADSDAFPHVGAEMPWTSPDGHITIVVRRGHFTWTVETYQGNLRITDNCGSYSSEAEARMVARGYATMYRAETTPAAPVVRQAPRNGQTTMTGPERRVIAAALNHDGRVARYKRDAQGDNYADIDMLQAMASRGFITLTGSKYRPTGGVVTEWGRAIHASTNQTS